MKKAGMYKINTFFHVILISTFFYLFPPQVFSLNEDTSQLDTLLFVSVSEERKGFINEIEEAVKNEKKHIQEILDSQTDRASRNLIIIAGAIIIPVSLFLLLWILKFLFNISFSIIRSLFSASASGVGAISKRLKDANQYKEEVVEETAPTTEVEVTTSAEGESKPESANTNEVGGDVKSE